MGKAMYYVMRFDREFPKPLKILKRPGIPGFEDLRFNDGVRIKGKLPVIEFKVDPERLGVFTDYLGTMLRLTISARFKSVLDRIGVDNVDYYPARIVNEATGEKRDDYFQANVVGVISCLDEDKTEMEVESYPGFPPMIGEISHMVLDESKISGELLFRLAEVTEIVIAHEKVKKAAEKAKLTGVVFLPANGYSWP
jgi:hypothetical protein